MSDVTGQVLAESLGLAISDSVAAALVQDTEYRQREIIHVREPKVLRSREMSVCMASAL